MLLVLPRNEAAARLGLEVAHLLLQDLRQRLGRRGRVGVARRGSTVVAGLLLPVLVPLGGVQDLLGVQLLLFADEQRHAGVVVAHEHVVGRAVHLLAGALVVGAVTVLFLFLVAASATTFPASVALPLQQRDEGRTGPEEAVGRRGVLQFGPVDVARLERGEGRGRRPRPAAAPDHGGPVPLHDGRAEDGVDLEQIPQELFSAHCSTSLGAGGGVGPDLDRGGGTVAALDLDPIAGAEDEDDGRARSGRLAWLGQYGLDPEELVEHEDAADVGMGPVGVQGHADQGGEGRYLVLGGDVVVVAAACAGSALSRLALGAGAL